MNREENKENIDQQQVISKEDERDRIISEEKSNRGLISPHKEKSEASLQEEVVLETNTNLVTKTYESVKEVVKPTNTQSSQSLKAEYELIWSDITITATVSPGCCSKEPPKTTVLLDKVSGKVKAGEALAIIGSSGAGKTTLLNYLSQKIETSNLKLEGTLKLNNQEINIDRFNSIASYVMQDDILEPVMTPLEVLLFTAKLKLNNSLEEIELKVQKMIDQLNLNKCKNTNIGSELERGVSGGERKRTSIGVELISDPDIIFLDEPTTGLDSYNAYELVDLLRTLANQGKMVIFTIHQPCSEIYELLQKIYVLGLGKTVYFGDTKGAYEMFETFGIPVPKNYNPFEHFIENTTLSVVEKLPIAMEFKEEDDNQEKYKKYITHLSDVFNENKHKYTNEESTISGFSDEILTKIAQKATKKNFCYDFAMLFGRNLIIAFRNKAVLILGLVQNIFMATILSILFMNLSREVSGIQDRLGLILMISMLTIFGMITSTILIFASERKVFVRERANNLYSIGAYFLAKTLGELPKNIIVINMFALIAYPSTFLNTTSSANYWIFVGVLQLAALIGSSFAYFLGSLSPNQEFLVNLNPIVSVPLMLLSGFFANSSNFAPYLRPFEYVSPFKYIYQMLVQNEYDNAQALNCANFGCDPLSTYAFKESFSESIIAVCSLVVGLKILSFIFIFFFSKIKV